MGEGISMGEGIGWEMVLVWERVCMGMGELRMNGFGS